MGRVAESGMVCNIHTRGPLQNPVGINLAPVALDYTTFRVEHVKGSRPFHLNNFPKGFAKWHADSKHTFYPKRKLRYNTAYNTTCHASLRVFCMPQVQWQWFQVLFFLALLSSTPQ